MTKKEDKTVSEIGHELRTLITLVLADLDILESENGKSEWIDDIRTECNRSSLLITKLMDAAPEANAESKVDASEQLLRMTRTFRPLGREKGLSLVTSIPDKVMTTIPRSDLVEMISVLLGNAIKYCDENGTITVSLKQEKEKFRLRIKNTFANAAALDTTKIFDRHYRESTVEEKSKGYGIGLPIAKDVASRNNGSVTVEANKSKDAIVATVVM